MEIIMTPGREDDEVPVTMFECKDREINLIGHDAGSSRLFVRFRNGRLQAYHGVAPNLFERFCTAPSKSDFWRTYIEGVLKTA